MKDFPALVPQELRLEGRGYLEAAADIKLSSAGKHLAPVLHHMMFIQSDCKPFI